MFVSEHTKSTSTSTIIGTNSNKLRGGKTFGKRLRKRFGLSKRNKNNNQEQRSNTVVQERTNTGRSKKRDAPTSSTSGTTSSSVSSVSSASTSSSIKASLSSSFDDDDEEEEKVEISADYETYETKFCTRETDGILSSLLEEFTSNTLDHHHQHLQVINEDSESTTTSTTSTTSLAKVDRFSFSTNLIQNIQSIGESRNYFITSKDTAAMMSDMNLDFTETLVEQFGQGKGIVEAHLFASNHLVKELLIVDKVVQTETAMPGTTQDTIFHALESFLYPRLSVLYMDMDSNEDVITPKDATELIAWMDSYLKLLSKQMPQVEVMDQWKQDMMRLSQYYLDKAVRSGMKELLSRAWELQQEDDVRQDADFHMVTGLPEQVAYMYTQQIATAQNLLPLSCSVLTMSHVEEQVVSICNEELAALVSDMQLKIASEWKEIPAFLFCAMINGAYRLAEHCEERNEKYFGRNNDGQHNDEALEQGHRLVKDLTELSFYATNYLCQRIMSDLCKPKNDILTSVGDEIWETDETCIAMERTIATLKDFFADLKVWLVSEYYFLRVLKTCFELTIQIYLESFFGNTLTHGVKDPQAAADELRRDFLRLVIFFNGSNFEKYHNVGDFYSQARINESLRILQNMASVLSPSNRPDFCHEDIVAILERFGSGIGPSNSRRDGSAAVLHLAGLRKQRLSGIESLVWVKAIAKAKKCIATAANVKNEQQQEEEQTAEDKEQGTKTAVVARRELSGDLTFVQVPDIRNSRFIRNLRPPVLKSADRSISNESRPHARSTLRLLDGTNATTTTTTTQFLEKAKWLYRTNFGVSTTLATTTPTTTVTAQTEVAKMEKSDKELTRARAETV